MFRFCFWVYACAMIGAYFSKALMDDFPAVLADPARIFSNPLGVRSVGGIACGFLAAVAWCRFHRLSALESLRRLDIIAYAMPVGWMIGRLGCTLAHDHRGLASTSWIAVNFPEGPRWLGRDAGAGANAAKPPAPPGRPPGSAGRDLTGSRLTVGDTAPSHRHLDQTKIDDIAWICYAWGDCRTSRYSSEMPIDGCSLAQAMPKEPDDYLS
jgi:Prolipoprotein diacylglyceryl transferase